MTEPTSATSSEMQLQSTLSLQEFETDEQRLVLDAISQIRECGLNSILSLPQIVVCGDQSSGKSSVLEALTEIPFPRSDNLCTRFATEISLRRDPATNITVKIIPGDERSATEQASIREYTETITDFGELPIIMENATRVMGIGETDFGSAFSKDVLSIEIQGPDRPHLTLVDIPGLIQSSTKGVTDADVAIVAGITESYIKQPRTICLAVVSAANDAANQPILQKVRRFDSHGERTLGVITKPDMLPSGSGTEMKFLELARNEDVKLHLGWHVIKNRKFEERTFSIPERNLAENVFFNTSSFKSLPKGHVGVDALRVRLSHLLFEHGQKELPRLQKDLENALQEASHNLKLLGRSRTTPDECRLFLTELSLKCYDIAKAGLNGHYEHDFFVIGNNDDLTTGTSDFGRRIRAGIQYLNAEFVQVFRTKGFKYLLDVAEQEKCDEQDAVKEENQEPLSSEEEVSQESRESNTSSGNPLQSSISSNPAAHSDHALLTMPQGDTISVADPIVCSTQVSLQWVKERLLRSRGTEVMGTFNPNLIAELFWEQSEKWDELARAHIERVYLHCVAFVRLLLKELVPTTEMRKKIWSFMIEQPMQNRRQDAYREAEKLIQDRRSIPINYNESYNDSVNKKRLQRMTNLGFDNSPNKRDKRIYGRSKTRERVERWGSLMETSCQDALDCLLAIYKVQESAFTANVVTQVTERHLVRGLQDIFSPMVIMAMSDSKVKSLVSESISTKQQRLFLADRIKKLEAGQKIFEDAMVI